MHQASLARRAEIALLTGDFQSAVSLAGQATAAALPGQFWGTGVGAVTLASARLAAGDPQGCLDTFAQFPDPGSAASAGTLRRLWHPELVQATLALGDPAGALEWARHGEKTAAGDLPARSAQAGLALSWALLANGDPDGAVAAARSAVDAFAAARLPIWEGRARAALGEALAGQGASDAAAVQYGRAKGLFAASGARALHTAVVGQQRSLGARQPRARTGQPGALTTRQREIAELVAQGLTNRQVAERLFMSPKTVDAHLSQIFSRLGISSRAALASRLAALDDDG
jgi:DNA-binding CsgD family transcriptional regulator